MTLANKIKNKLVREKKKWRSAIGAMVLNPYQTKALEPNHLDFLLQLKLNGSATNVFDVFAIEPLDVASIPKEYWSCDHRTQNVWPYKWHSLLPYKLLGESDVKVPWELGRGQCFTQLAYYCAANDYDSASLTKAVDEFRTSNPVGYGVQWQCSMDVSIRLVNLIHSMSLMKGSLEQGAAQKFAACLSEHYAYIHSNPEVFDNGFRNNHYLADLMGRIFYLTLFTDKHSEASVLFEEMLQEFDSQFLDDGGNFEGSVAYHFLSLEIVVLSISIYAHSCLRTEESFNITQLSKILNKLRLAVKFAHTSCSTHGFPSRIGDDDSGMVIRPCNLSEVELSERNRFVAQHRLMAFDTFIEELMQGWDQQSYCKVFSALFGVSGEPSLNPTSTTQVSFPDFGLYKFEQQGFELYFRHIKRLGCNGKGGHNHCDDGSFELFVDGLPCIVDPGTYGYTSNANKRNYYRSTAQHNVVNGYGREAFHFTSDDKMLFELKEHSTTQSKVKTSGNSISHSTNRLGVTQTRIIQCNSDQIDVFDQIDDCDGELNLTFHPDVDLEVQGQVIHLASLDTVIELTGAKRVELINKSYSDYYLNERACKSIQVTFTEHMGLNIKREL